MILYTAQCSTKLVPGLACLACRMFDWKWQCSSPSSCKWQRTLNFRLEFKKLHDEELCKGGDFFCPTYCPILSCIALSCGGWLRFKSIQASIPFASAATTSKCPGHCELAQIYRRRVFSTSCSSNGFVQIPLRLWFVLKGRWVCSGLDERCNILHKSKARQLFQFPNEVTDPTSVEDLNARYFLHWLINWWSRVLHYVSTFPCVAVSLWCLRNLHDALPKSNNWVFPKNRGKKPKMDGL